MSSGLRLPAVSGHYYASVVDGNATYYTVNGSGVWSSATNDVDMTGLVFRDLGKVVYFHPVNSLTTGQGAPASVAQTAPPVDVRRVAVVDATGVVTGTTYYVPLGTRARGTRAQQHEIPSCWIAQTAAAVAH